MVNIKLYPFIAAAIANPIPVFPPVGSINVSPFCMILFFSASSIICIPTLAFILPPGLNSSIFT